MDKGESPAQPDLWARYDPWAAPAPQDTPPPPPADPRQRRGRRRLLLVVALVSLLAGTAGGAAGARYEREGGSGVLVLPDAAPAPGDRPPGSLADLAARTLPGVVTLHAAGDRESGTGTGFVLDRQGHILTNNHVVAPALNGGDLAVVFGGGQGVRAEVVGRDAGYDLAVVRVRGVRNLTALPLGDSDQVRVGDPVVAVGSPFDLANTVTSGIISAKERPVTAGGQGTGSGVAYVDALQTDAPINPGNSGGPLVDERGRVIGINSAIRSAEGAGTDEENQAGSVGLGFAIPVNQARRVAREIIEHGHASHPVIGVRLDSRAQDEGDGGGGGEGARIAAGHEAVTEDGPADRAGLRPGDLVTRADGRPVTSGDDLIVRVRAHRPGDELRLTYRRNGHEHVTRLTLGSSEDDS